MRRYYRLAIILIVGIFGVANSSNGLFDFPKHRHAISEKEIQFSEQDLLNAISIAELSINRLQRLETSISNSNIKIANASTSYGQLLDSLPNDDAKHSHKIAKIVLKASVHLLNNYCRPNGVSDKRCAKIMSTYQIPNSDLLNKCLDIQHSNSLNSYRRLLPAAYQDGLYKIPSGRKLPSPKNISDELFLASQMEYNFIPRHTSSEGILDDERNIALVQWSQFIEHDLVKSVAQTMDNDVPIECCQRDSSDAPPRYLHPACAPLKFNLHNYTRGVTCLNYVRSTLDVNSHCRFGPAEQLNQATNTLDLSQLYGITNNITSTLRSYRNGELKTSVNDPNQSTLPEVDAGENLCMHSSTNKLCYKSGDSRVNINPYVTSIYTIFLRSHNQLAKLIKRRKRTWSDERIFQLARRINVAIYQKIIYEEWAPVVLGKDMGQLISGEKFSSNLEMAVSNEFATAAIRFYYSMMPGDLRTKPLDVHQLIDESTELLELKDEFYKPRNLAANNVLENIIDAILQQKAMAMDTGYVDDVIHYLFKFKNSERKLIGSDALALDIQRSRDHGLNKYIKYLGDCKNDVINDWDDLNKYINPREIEVLKKIYKTVHDIDLIVGGISEIARRDATVGPTFACIIGEQLSNTRRSDNLFYTANEQIHNGVSQYTGARLICDTTKLDTVPTNIFYVPSDENPMVNCEELRTLPKITLRHNTLLH